MPYLVRRGYDIDKDISFEVPTEGTPTKRFVDISVTAGGRTPKFLIEAKRRSHKLTEADRTQAINYGLSLKVPFVALTNGQDLELINTSTRAALSINGRRSGRAMLPHKSQLPKLIKWLRAHPTAVSLDEEDETLPYRPGLPLKQLNALFARCHNKIRNLEKNEDNAFADFSKFLFLRLLEEKADDSTSQIELPYSARFHELADRPEVKADEVKTLVDSMIAQNRKIYGDVITEGLKLKQAKTYHYLVTELSKVSFTDSGLDTKGAAFEYFVRATLKGKKLGQYFTPRPLVELMLELVGRQLIVNSVAAGQSMKVLDPACGTGGFLVFLLKDALDEIARRRAVRTLTPAAATMIRRKLMAETFFGIDANPGVASSAKMNMIISGDGHTNIEAANSLEVRTKLWSLEEGAYDLIISNPPFGTSESDLSADDLAAYPVPTKKGQLLFLQRMLKAVRPQGTVCTVIDDGALNTDTARGTREFILDNARVRAVVSLPASTFKPNKITVKSSVLVLERFDEAEEDPLDDYDVLFIALSNLGFHPSGETIRGFAFAQLRSDMAEIWDKVDRGDFNGDHWRAFKVSSADIRANGVKRLDFKYWDVRVREQIDEIRSRGGKTLLELNQIDTDRGKSPTAALYVDREDGYAQVVKAGSSITSYGEVVDSGDWIEKAVYDDLPGKCKLEVGDVLLSSTGDGTLGKSAVYDSTDPAVADGHVTILRIDPNVIDPHYLADYLRVGFGRVQSNRLFSGSTGLIELTVDHANSIIVPMDLTVEMQRRVSTELRAAEKHAREEQELSLSRLSEARSAFSGFASFDADDSATDGDISEMPVT
ncbi:N-6 DNA methylase [Amycolatopsis minnesotensis]|uniref:N-6 DNA methylase n=1 Tax=Amycolatopsis minnesotensis TaxID=337894 RepID=A0ABP5D099_9PSEU